MKDLPAGRPDIEGVQPGRWSRRVGNVRFLLGYMTSMPTLPTGPGRAAIWALCAVVGLASVSGCVSGSDATGASVATTVGSSMPSVPSTGDPASSTSTTLGFGLKLSANPWDRARELGLIAPDGTYQGPTGSDGEPLLVDAISGYGDFSDQDRFLIDWVLVNSRVVDCMNDHGFAVTLHPDGLGSNWAAIPPEQNQLAQAVNYACRDGLRIPSREPFSRSQWEELFAYQLGLADCIDRQGYDTTDPPTIEAFIESEGAIWDAYIGVQVQGTAWDQLVRACPPAPPGGFGAWDPGDPVGQP